MSQRNPPKVLPPQEVCPNCNVGCLGRCTKSFLDATLCRLLGMKTDLCLDFRIPCYGVEKTEEQLSLEVAARLINPCQMDAEIQLSRKDDAKYMRSFLLHTSTIVRWTYNILAWSYLLAAMFEPPALFNVIPLWLLWTFELICLIYFTSYTYVGRNFMDSANICDFRNIVTIVACVACFADCLGAVALYYSNLGVAIRYSRPFRPVFVASGPFSYQLRKAITCTVKTVRDVTFAMIMLIGSVLLYAVLAYRLFTPKKLRYPDGTPWFPTFNMVLWELYVLMTTANSPDVMLPIFKVSPPTCFFFVSYLILNFYLFMGFVLAVVVDTYKKHMKRDVINYVLQKRRSLDQAFHLVSKKMENNEFYVTRDTFRGLMHYLRPQYGTIQNEILFQMMEPKADEYVAKDMFLSLSEFLPVEVAYGIGPTNVIGQLCPALYASRYSISIVKLANSNAFLYTADIFILLNVILYIANCNKVELFFLVVFTLEILLKLYGKPAKKFWCNSWNKFDVLVVVSAWTIEILDTFKSGVPAANRANVADIILVMRILRITRVMRLIPGFRNILSTLKNILPSLVSFGNILVLLYYVCAMVGMELFGGRIKEDGSANCGNPKLNFTEFAIKRYCSMNFNNIGQSYLTLFTLMVVNQWHVLTDGFVAVTTQGSRIYFICFHMSAVIIILNIINAFILEVFLMNYEAHQNDVLNAVESKIVQLGLGFKQNPDEKMLHSVDAREFRSLKNSQDYFICDKEASSNVWACLEQLFAVDLKELGVRRAYSTSEFSDKSKANEEYQKS